MAYTLVAGFVRATSEDVDWVETDLSQVPVNGLLTQYKDVYLQLSNPVVETPLYLTRDLIVANMPLAIPSPTLSAWLAGLGDATLQTTSVSPDVPPIPARYADALQAGYKLTRSDHTTSPDNPQPPVQLPDLLITKDGIDFSSMAQYLLVSVNGYWHQSSGSVNGLYVLDGGTSSRIANRPHAGIISFLPIGTIQQIPITSDMLFKPNSSLNWAQSAYVDTGVDLTGKSVIAVIGGYLHVKDGVVEKTSERAVKLNMHLLPLVQRYYQSQSSIDLSSLPFDSNPNNPDQHTVASLVSDPVVEAYLTLSQSFLIVVDTPKLYRRTWQLERPTYPGRFFNQSGYRYPLFGPYGRAYDYRLSVEEDTYVYGTEPVMRDHYLFETTDYLNQLSVSNNREGARRTENTDAYLLEFGALT